MEALRITSPAFKQKETIPSQYTCDGVNTNPPLKIENIPPQAQSLALIVDDPDAPGGTFVHWVVWNIDPNTEEIREGHLPKGAHQGINDFKAHHYGGPCPPSGTHRYFFKLYALDTMLDLGENTTKERLERAMKGHIISESEVIGLYHKQ